MPLPLIPVVLGGASLLAGAFGAKKGYDAYSDKKMPIDLIKTQVRYLKSRKTRLINKERQQIAT